MLGPSGPSVSASGLTSTFDGPFSNPTMPAMMEGNGSNMSNMCAIIGGVVGGVVGISILVAALFFLRRRRRRSLMSSPVFDGEIAIDPHMDQASRSTSSQGTVSSCPPETPISLLRPYVRIFHPLLRLRLCILT
jgi:hypothetical protein